VEYDHHAFLWWAPANLAVIPVSQYSERQPFSGAIGFRVDRAAGISEAGRASHGSADSSGSPGGYAYLPQIRRSLVVGSRLFTLSELGVEGPPPPEPAPAR
jgi:hypothetical protein